MFPYRAHTEPLFYANKLLDVCDINLYTIGIFMYQFVNENLPGYLQVFVWKKQR